MSQNMLRAKTFSIRMLKKIGLIGGLGFPSTQLYYEKIHRAFENEYEVSEGFPEYPEVIIISLNHKKFEELETNTEWDECTELISDAISRLEKAGASFGAISCNTVHHVFSQLRKESPIQLLSIVEETFKYMKEKGFKRTLLLGSSITMRFPFYRDVFGEEIKIEIPDVEDIEFIEKHIMEELVFGIAKEETKKSFIEIIEKAKKDKKVDCVILGCTEIPLLLSEKYYCGLEIVNTAEVHVKSIVEYCMKEQSK